MARPERHVSHAPCRLLGLPKSPGMGSWEPPGNAQAARRSERWDTGSGHSAAGWTAAPSPPCARDAATGAGKQIRLPVPRGRPGYGVPDAGHLGVGGWKWVREGAVCSQLDRARDRARDRAFPSPTRSGLPGSRGVTGKTGRTPPSPLKRSRAPRSTWRLPSGPAASEGIGHGNSAPRALPRASLRPPGQ